MYEKSDPCNKKKNRRFNVTYALCREICEMLKITWFVLSFVQKVILSNFKFWRARGQWMCQYVDPWPEVDVYWIWLIYDEW